MLAYANSIAKKNSLRTPFRYTGCRILCEDKARCRFRCGKSRRALYAAVFRLAIANHDLQADPIPIIAQRVLFVKRKFSAGSARGRQCRLPTPKARRAVPAANDLKPAAGENKALPQFASESEYGHLPRQVINFPNVII